MNYFILFSNCIVTVGLNRSIICDLQEMQIYFIPNEVSRLIKELRNKTVEDVRMSLDLESRSIFDNYIEYFLSEEIGFYCGDPRDFPEISMDYNSSEIINNAILDLDKNSTYDIGSVIKDLINLRCKFLEIRIYDEISIVVIEQALEKISSGFFRNVDIIYKYPTNRHDLDLLKQLVHLYPIIGTLTLHTSPIDNDETYLDTIKTIKQAITNNKCCGKITVDYFSLDIKTISESQISNTCLNQKISIDVSGNIKNCPSMVERFGNIDDSSLTQIVNLKTFRNKWSIKKDQIKICNHCEFRHVCTDCRAFLEDPNDIYSKPLKCGYDPESNTWEDWSENSLKMNAIKHYSF